MQLVSIKYFTKYFIYFTNYILILIILLLDKTNALKFELYAIIGQIDGAGFAAAYLFLDNTKKDEGVRTEILTAFLSNLKKLGLQFIKYFLTDKDWSQINAAKAVWNNCKIQLCLWHAKKSIKKKLADNSEPKHNTYNSIEANSKLPFIDIQWYPIIPPNSPFIFCPKKLQTEIIELFTRHFHLHPLIPLKHGEFLSSEDIWEISTKEMYDFCYTNNLKYVWGYMWCNWYKFNLWVLWARAAVSDEICIFKTTMLLESHWKVIKRNFLPRFFRPRLDLVTFIIVTRLMPHNEIMYNKYQNGREKVSWRKDFKKHWKDLTKRELSGELYYTNTDQWICSCPAFLKDRFFLCKHLVKSVNDIITPEFFNNVQRQGNYPLLGMISKEQNTTFNSFNTTLLNIEGNFKKLF